MDEGVVCGDDIVVWGSVVPVPFVLGATLVPFSGSDVEALFVVIGCVVALFDGIGCVVALLLVGAVVGIDVLSIVTPLDVMAELGLVVIAFVVPER